jgi:protein O-GlcNAc transferase
LSGKALGHARALHKLSVRHAQSGRFHEALQSVDQAIGLAPENAELHFHRAEVLCAMGRREQALEDYREAIALRPDYAEAVNNLGDTLLALGRAAEALAQFERALELKPGFLLALNNRGNALQALGRHDAALLSYDRALAQEPGSADILNNRANALLSLRRLEEAEADSRKALALQPGHVEALLNLGKAQFARSRFDDALQSFDAAIAAGPNHADAWRHRGMALATLRRHQEAWSSYERAIALKPDFADAWIASGVLYSELAQFDKAIKCYRQALAAQPGSVSAKYHIADALRKLEKNDEALAALEEVLRLDPDYDYVRGQLAWLRRQRCDWRSFAADCDGIVASVRAGKRVAEPFEFLVLTDNAGDQLQCARSWSQHQLQRTALPLWRGERYRHDRPRIAYVSADFRGHPISYLLAGLFEQHDRARFETFGIGFGAEDRGPVATRVTQAFEHFVDITAMNHIDAARMLREHEIDIAVDLMGYTKWSRPGIFMLRPCPVQVNYLGLPATMGAEFMDYFIADPFVAPAGADPGYAEKLVRLPDSFQGNDSARRGAERTPAKAEVGLPAHGVVFCSFNNSAKITPQTFGVWMEILRGVEHSVLWIYPDHAALQENLRREAQARGVDGSRLVFAAAAHYPEHLARLRLADLFLDTLPFNAGATASDALWSGVPVITMPGEAFAARMAGSLLHAVGMPELVTSSLEEYQALAIRLGRNPELLTATKAKLARNRLTQPLFDTGRFRRHLEAAYLAMWERAQRGEPPAAITVQAASSATSTTR